MWSSPPESHYTTCPSNDSRVAMKHATCQQQKSEVHSAVANFPSEPQCRSTVLLLYQQLQLTTVKSPCCPVLKYARHHTTKIFSPSQTTHTRNWCMHCTNFTSIPALCTLSSICLQSQTKKPAASSSSPASQQINSTLKRSRSTLNLSFSVAHSLISFPLISFSFVSQLNLFISSKHTFHSTCHLPSILRLHHTSPSTYFLRQPSTIYWFNAYNICIIFP